MKKLRNGFRIFLAVILFVFILSAVTMAASKQPRLNKKKLVLYVGGKETVKVLNRGKSKVSFSVGNKKVASVNRKGVVKGRRPGKTTIRVKVGKKRLKCTVIVKTPPKKKLIIIGPTTLTIGDFEQYTYSEDVLLDSIEWKSSNPSILEVNSKSGTAKAVNAGTAAITLSGVYKGKSYSASLNVTVNEPAEELDDKQIKAELAAAKSQGPVAFIECCLKHRKHVFVADGEYDQAYGAYDNLGQHVGIDVTADYKWAVDTLCAEWFRRIEAGIRTDKTDDKLLKMVMFCDYLHLMYQLKKIEYGGNTQGWMLCPTIARALKEEPINGNIIHGTCFAYADILKLYGLWLGLDARITGRPGHAWAQVIYNGDTYEFDMQTGMRGKVENGVWNYYEDDGTMAAIYKEYGYNEDVYYNLIE